MMRKFFFSLVLFPCILMAHGQSPESLFAKVQAKFSAVRDYRVRAVVGTDVEFLKTQQGQLNIYFKRPNHFKAIRHGGITIFPKGMASVNIAELLARKKKSLLFMNAGMATISGHRTRVLKILPMDASSEDLIMGTLYVDPVSCLIYKAEIASKNSGNYTLQFSYGKAAAFGLPDELYLFFKVDDYKMVRGLTLDMEDNPKMTKNQRKLRQHGWIRIRFSDYRINHGLSDSFFR